MARRSGSPCAGLFCNSKSALRGVRKWAAEAGRRLFEKARPLRRTMSDRGSSDPNASVAMLRGLQRYMANGAAHLVGMHADPDQASQDLAHAHGVELSRGQIMHASSDAQQIHIPATSDLVARGVGARSGKAGRRLWASSASNLLNTASRRVRSVRLKPGVRHIHAMKRS